MISLYLDHITSSCFSMQQNCKFVYLRHLWLDQRIHYSSGSPILTDSQLLCRQPLDHRLSPSTGQSQTLYIQGCYWWGCFAQQDRDGHIPCQRGISSQLRCHAACQQAGWLWTGHRGSVWQRQNTGRSA